MAVRDVFKVSRKTFWNPRAWLGYDELKFQTQSLWDILRGIFIIPAPVHQETFDEAMKRLKLTPADIKATIRNYQLYALLFLKCRTHSLTVLTLTC